MKKSQPKEKKWKLLGEPEVWESGDKVSEATPLEHKDGLKGISVRLRSKSNPYSRNTILIEEGIDLPSWLDWARKAICNLYLKIFGKKVLSLDDELGQYKAEKENLTKQLAETQKKLEDAEKRVSENKVLLEYAAKVKDQIITFESTLYDLKSTVTESVNNNLGREEDIKNKIKKNPWLLGLECSVEAKNQDVDIQTQIDLHVKTKYGQDRIFELKSPNLKPFQRKNDDEKRRVTISPELSEGLSELILYLERTDIHSNQKIEGTYGITKPAGYILIGYGLGEEETRFLRYINFHLCPHIQITTYDELIANAERELEVIKTVKAEGVNDSVAK